MCDNCSAVVGELNRQTYRLRVMLCLERLGWRTEGMNVDALQRVVSDFNAKVLARDCAERLIIQAIPYGLERRRENYSIHS